MMGNGHAHILKPMGTHDKNKTDGFSNNFSPNIYFAKSRDAVAIDIRQLPIVPD